MTLSAIGTAETRPSGATTYTYDAADELTQTSGPGGTTAYAYDLDGNETQAGSRSFTYDLANRIASTSAGGTPTTYGYDGDGKRLSATTGGSTTSYVWDVAHRLPQIALERDGSGSTLRSYLYGNAMVSMLSGGSAYYFHRDGLGSTVNLTSAMGATEWSYAYEPYGSVRSTTQNDPQAPTNPIRFAGELLDAQSGLYDLRARQYDPATGRFTSLDPLPQSIADPSVARYLYANDRPTSLVDPSGMGPVWINGDGCTSFANFFQCTGQWISEGAGFPDYWRGLHNDPATVITGTAADILGVVAIYGAVRLTPICAKQVTQIHKPHCGFIVGGLGGVGYGLIASGTATIQKGESKGQKGP